MCKKCIWKNMLDFLCFNLYLETFGLHPFLNRFVVFNKNFVPLNHSYKGKFDSLHLRILF